MGRYQELIGRQIYTVLAMLFAVILSLSLPTELNAQTKKGLQMKMAGADTSEVLATAEEGVPERGQFQFVYSYSGEPISPEISISVNGSQIVSLGSLGPTTNDTLVNRAVGKGDNIDLYASFGIAEATIFLHTGLEGYTPGFWAGWGSITFYEFDPSDGSVIQVYGTMDYEYYHIPPWNGITVEADPESISPGDSSSITLQPYETPSEPVIIPDVTYINLQTSFLGDLIGGLGLPEYGLRYVQGFNNAPWGLLRDTDILYEVHPSIEASDNFEIPVVAYSPYDTGINGSTAIEVKKEDDLQISVTTEDDEVYPQQTNSPTETIVIVNVTRDDEPEPGVPVSLTVKAVPFSGGHNHDKSRTTGELTPSSGMTDENGRFTTTYTSSEIAGREWIVAQSSQTSQTDSTELKIQLQNLEKLVSGTNYQLIGMTDIHPNNHWGTKDVIKSIKSIANSWKTMFPDETDLMINDISLQYGGVLDFKENWSNPHSTHRTGQDIDLRTEFPEGIDEYPKRPGVPIRNPRNSAEEDDIIGNKAFERLVLRNGAREIEIHGTLRERSEHYHIDY